MRVLRWICVIFCFSSCAQTTNLIVNKYAFYNVVIPGNIPVDENGRPRNLRIDTAIYVFAETSKKEIQWEKAWINGKEKKANPILLSVDSVFIGYDKAMNNPIIIRAKAYLWQLYFSDIPNSGSRTDLENKRIVLQGNNAGKTFSIAFESPSEFRRPEPNQ